MKCSPVREDFGGASAFGIGLVTLDHFPDLLDFISVLKFFEAYHLLVAASWKIAGLIEDISNSAGHTGSEIPSCRAEDDDTATGHILAPMIADGFDYGSDSTVANAEPLASHATDVGFASSGAVKRDIADDDI